MQLIFRASESPAGIDAFPVDSDDALELLTPTLGPTATVVLHRLARWSTLQSTAITSEDLAATFGVQHHVLVRALKRLTMFHLLTPLDIALNGDCTYIVRMYCVPEKRWLERLPAYMQGESSDA